MDKQELLELIKYHNREYRRGAPEISDTEYDKLVDTLRETDPDNEWFKKVEPAAVPSGRKVKLPIPMKSLKKVKSIKELQNWFDSIGLRQNDTVVLTPKFDGLSLLYNERTGQAYSRGGSENEGQDCTEHVKMANIPKCEWAKLQFTFGEFVFLRDTWEEVFSDKVSPETGERYKSPRNTAAGLINRNEPIDLLRHVDFFRYGTDEVSLKSYRSYMHLIEHMCRAYKQRPLYLPLKVADVTENFLRSCYNTWNGIYFCDGLVIYANDFSVWKRVGRQENTGNPNYAIAYKDPDFTETFETAVKGVSWKISKSGALKPVVNIEKVFVGDCDIENPTGYNAKWINENKIGKGAIVKITRSGGIIPKILEVVSPASQERFVPASCPSCGAPLSWNSSGVEICCNNPSCPGVALAKILHFYKTLGAEQIGEETLSRIFNSGYASLKSILDITFEEILDIEGFGESFANTLLGFNSRIKAGVDISLLMHASDCFSGIGQVKASQLLSKMDASDRFAFTNGLVKIPENYEQTDEYRALGKVWQNFFSGITSFYDFVATNKLKINPMSERPRATSNKYAGMKVCFTGIRDKLLEDQIIAGGGEIVSGVSKKTTHLIVADKNRSSAKMRKAKELNVSIMTTDEFEKFANG